MQTQSLTTHINQQSNFLSKAMRANGVFSGISGIVFMIGANPIATFLGVEMPLAFMVLGVMLIGYAILLLAVTRTIPIMNFWAWMAICLDVVWVVASYVLIFSNLLPFTTAGKWAIALIAEVVFLFTIAQAIGFYKQSR